VPRIGGHDAIEKIAGQRGALPLLAGQDLLGWQSPATIHPGQEGAHVAGIERGGVEQRGQQ
jgi:hypothetical protein